MPPTSPAGGPHAEGRGGARHQIEIEPTDELGPEPWAVEWTNDLGDFRYVHYAKRAAQRHVANMLKLLQPDQSKDDVLTVIRRV